MDEEIKRIKGMVMDLLGDLNNKEIVSKITESVKNIIYKDNELTLTKEILDNFQQYDMNILIYNNTNNVTNQYILYLSYQNKLGLQITTLTKEDIIN